MEVLNKINKNFKRVDNRILEQFKGIPVANIDDVMGRMCAISSQIKAVNEGNMVGNAFTIRVGAGDNLFFHAALDLVKPDDIVLIDAGGYEDRAITGEIMISYIKKLGAKGIVIDGAIRDVESLSKLKNFMVYAKSQTPNGPFKNGPGYINFPISIGGVLVSPGDIVVGDQDGIIVIKPSEVKDVLKKALKIKENEDKLLERIEKDANYDRPWLQDKLIEIGAEYIEEK